MLPFVAGLLLAGVAAGQAASAPGTAGPKPDGGPTIVFLSGMRDVYDIYAMNADGTGIRRLTRWTANPTTGGRE